MADKNVFGGGNASSLYTPMSEDEQEVIQRLIEEEDLEIHIVNWGVVNKFEKVSFGDLRLQIVFRVILTAPAIHMAVPFFELELKTRSGILLIAERYPLKDELGGPLRIGAGSELVLIWYVAIRQMDPDFVKLKKPGSIGLTSREGNYKLPAQDMKLLRTLRVQEERLKEKDRKEIQEISKDFKIE